MPRRRPQKTRPPASPTTLQLDVEAKQLLREIAPRRSMGAFVSGLIWAEVARREERERLRRLLEV
jgi:hypothetical protein